jgi:hypothetical protein
VKKLIALLLICGMVTFTLTGVTGCGDKGGTGKTGATGGTKATGATGDTKPTGGEEKKP